MSLTTVLQIYIFVERPNMVLFFNPTEDLNSSVSQSLGLTIISFQATNSSL